MCCRAEVLVPQLLVTTARSACCAWVPQRAYSQHPLPRVCSTLGAWDPKPQFL